MFFVLAFILGLLFGSFGSVILYRLQDGVTRKQIRSILVGRSYCPHCKHILAWYDLFPLFSWLITGGKCRYCGAKVSKRYPLLELGCGLIFLGVFYRWTIYGAGDIGLLLIVFFLNRCFYLLMVHDIDTMYLHDAVWWMAAAGAIVLLMYQATTLSIIDAGMWIAVYTIGFGLFYWLAKGYVRLRFKENAEGIGQGDVMLAPIVGIVLWKATSYMMMSEGMDRMLIIQIFWYYVIAACISALLLLVVTPITHEHGKRLIPFFPGMIVGVRILMALLPWILQTMSSH